MVVAGDPPDLVHTNFIPMFTYAGQGATVAIDPYLDRRGKGDYFEWPRDGATYKGKIHMWPFMLNPTGVVANRSVFAEKNATNLLPQPGAKADWTFDQWRAALRAGTTLTGDPERDVYGTAFIAGSTTGDYWQMMYLWGNGAELYDKDEKKVTVCSQSGYDALQMLVDLIHRDRVAMPGAVAHWRRVPQYDCLPAA